MESKVFKHSPYPQGVCNLFKEKKYIGVYVLCTCAWQGGESKGGERRMTIQRSICQISRSSQKKEIIGN